MTWHCLRSDKTCHDKGVLLHYQIQLQPLWMPDACWIEPRHRLGGTRLWKRKILAIQSPWLLYKTVNWIVSLLGVKEGYFYFQLYVLLPFVPVLKWVSENWSLRIVEKTAKWMIRSQGNIVSTVPSCRLDDWGIMLWFLIVVTGFSLPQSFQTSSWVHPASWSDGKSIPLQAWTSPEGSMTLRLPDFKTYGTWRW
jgi:hypothetical protein